MYPESSGDEEQDEEEEEEGERGEGGEEMEAVVCDVRACIHFSCAYHIVGNFTSTFCSWHCVYVHTSKGWLNSSLHSRPSRFSRIFLMRLKIGKAWD